MDVAYRIRAARAEDVEAVVALERGTETLPHWRVADYLGSLPLGHREDNAQGACRCMVVAEREADTRVMGFAVGKVTRIEANVTAELESVGLAETARRSGVGNALCEAVIAWSRKMGASEIELEVRSRSAGPISLYSGLGFVAAGRRSRYYREPEDDAILMRLDLAP